MGVVNNKHKTKIKYLSLIITAITIISSLYIISNSDANATNSYSINNISVNATESNITFTGNVGSDFNGHLIYNNINSSAWGPENNISKLYLSYNSSYLFIGIQEIISDNGLLVALSNDTGSNDGTNNMTNLNTWARSIIFSSTINEFSAVWFNGNDNTQISGNNSYIVTSKVSDSNISPFATQIKSIWDLNSSNDSVEIAIPLSDVYANDSGIKTIGIAALVIGGSSSWVGTAVPYNQNGPYSKGSTYFMVNNEIKVNNIKYFPRASNENPYYGNIIFTGNVSNDFAGHLIYYNFNASKWGGTNNISDLYFAYNSTNLFFGFREDILGNSLFLALSNNTGSIFGTYNFTMMNVWSRNITFVNPVNYFSAVYFSGSGQPQGNNSYIINSNLNESNTSPQAVPIKSEWDFNSANMTAELSIPLNQILSTGVTSLNLSMATL